jgi:hypothetical protein
MTEQLKAHSNWNRDLIILNNAKGYAEDAIRRMEAFLENNPDNETAVETLRLLKAGRQWMDSVLEEMLL